MLGKISIFLTILLIAVNPVFALDINTYTADFNIVNDKVMVEITLTFEKTTDLLEFMIADDYGSLSVYIDEELINTNITDNILKIDIKNNSKLRFNYITKEFIDKTNFLMDMKLNFDVDNLKIKLVLPEGATLKKPIKAGDLTSGSVYPKPSSLTSDGKSLIFYWERQDMKQGDEISIFTQIENKGNPLLPTLLIFVILVIIVGIIFYTRKPVIIKGDTKIIIKKEDMVEKHLKDEEEQIVNVLKLKEGSCEQGTLRVATGFSKASLSRLLKELEDRKVIYKEKRGKKNLVFLQK